MIALYVIVGVVVYFLAGGIIARIVRAIGAWPVMPGDHMVPDFSIGTAEFVAFWPIFIVVGITLVCMDILGKFLSLIGGDKE